MTRSGLGDVALAVPLTVVGIFGTVGADMRTDADRPIDAAGLALVVAAALVVVVRRRWPLVTLVAATMFTATYLAVGYTYGPILLSFVVAVYTVARHHPLGKAVPAALAAVALLLVHLFTNDNALPGFVGVIPASAWVTVPFAIGVTARLTQESMSHARTEAVRQRVDDERLRVAQEVHDIVGHGLAAIKMQADVALHVLPKKPEQAEAALNAISRTSTDALDELRATLAVVRPGDSEPTRSPRLGLDRLDDLNRRMSAAGVHVRRETTGTARELPAAVDLAGYRIVQESLTNVLRHSEAKVATVRIRYETDAVVITISNAAVAITNRSDGIGIPGMRKRLIALGGDFAAGPTSDGQFEVRASIPTGDPT
ncbi:MAG: sensor histidine kinase [Nocardioidaceae bacterium]